MTEMPAAADDPCRDRPENREGSRPLWFEQSHTLSTEQRHGGKQAQRCEPTMWRDSFRERRQLPKPLCAREAQLRALHQSATQRRFGLRAEHESIGSLARTAADILRQWPAPSAARAGVLQRCLSHSAKGENSQAQLREAATHSFPEGQAGHETGNPGRNGCQNSIESVRFGSYVGSDCHHIHFPPREQLFDREAERVKRRYRTHFRENVTHACAQGERSLPHPCL